MLRPVEGHVVPGLCLPLCTWEAARLARLTTTQQAPRCLLASAEERWGLLAHPLVPSTCKKGGTGGPGGWAQVPRDGARAPLFHMKPC